MPVTQAARAAAGSVHGIGESAKGAFVMLLSWLGAAVSSDYDAQDLRHYAYGQENTVLGIVTAAAVAVVGTLIVGEINNALPTPDNAQLANASEGLIGGFGDAMNLLPVVFIVLVSALVISVVRNF